MTKVVDPVAAAAKANAQFEADLNKMFDHLQNANNPDKALVHFEAKLEKMGANVSVNDPAGTGSNVTGTPGQHDIFILNEAAQVHNNGANLREFTPGEDFVVLLGAKGHEMDFQILDNHPGGTWGVMNNTNASFEYGSATQLFMWDTPDTPSLVGHTILGLTDWHFYS